MAGRPKQDNSRDLQYRLRLNEEEADMLETISVETKQPKSDAIREALYLYHLSMEYSKNNADNKDTTENEKALQEFFEKTMNKAKELKNESQAKNDELLEHDYTIRKRTD